MDQVLSLLRGLKVAPTADKEQSTCCAPQRHGRSTVSISSLANGALGEHRGHETHEPAPVLEVLEPQPIGSAFEPEIEIPQ
jgi:hypothetical protein